MKNLYSTLLLLTSLFSFMAPSLSGQTDMNIPIKGICIYIDYPDAAPEITPTQLDEMLNDLDYQTPDMNRSFRKYWQQETRRNVDLQHDIFYYTAPMPATHYATLQWYEGIELWHDALNWVIANHPTYDWSQLSKWSISDPFNSERPNYLAGAIKSVIILSSAYGPAGIGAAHGPQWTLTNGQFIGNIQGSSLQRPWDATLNLFTICHETGHSLFNLPDTYDYDASSGGTAKYTVMSAQGPDVEPIGAPFLYQNQFGYIKEPTEGTHTYTLPADGDTIVIIKNIHDPHEFFALEVRKNSTLGNSLFPSPLGLLIWHSDLKVHTGNNLEDGTRYAHYKHSIIQKDGLLELEQSGPSPPINSGDIFQEGDSFNDDSTPDAHWWAGESSGIEVKDIIQIDANTMQFTVVIPEPHDEHEDFIPKTNWSLISATPSQSGYDGTKAFDDDPSTYYHVPYGSNKPRPHELAIDLGAEYEFTEFYYTANDNYSSPWEGRIKDYNLFVSADGLDWGTPVAAEQFFNTPYRQYILLPKTVARYIKLSALNVHSNDDRTSIAEIDIRGKETEMTGIDTDQSSVAPDIRLSPNPTTGVLHIHGLQEDYVVKINDPLGICTRVITNPGSSITLNLMDQPAGIWSMTIYDASNRPFATQRFLKLN